MDFKKEKSRLEKAFTEKRYQQRFSIVKEGKASLEKKDIINAAKKYHEYLQILALVYNSKPFDLKPDLFKGSPVEETEQLLLSQIYYDLAKIYDLSAKKTTELDQCLNQFIRFTINQRYQVLNSETIRKDIQAGRVLHKAEFIAIRDQIYKGSKKCYLATYVYGEEHEFTVALRTYRDQKLIFSSWGRKAIRIYYYFSPKIISLSHKNKFLDHFLKMTTREFVKKIIPLLGEK